MSITLVCGPPGAGKTRYVRERMKHGDLIVERDALAQALSGLPKYEKPTELFPFSEAAFWEVLRRVGRDGHTRNVWIVACAATKQKRQRICDAVRRPVDVVVLAVAPQECLRRIIADPERKAKWELWRPWVERWWNEYQSAEGDKVIR